MSPSPEKTEPPEETAGQQPVAKSTQASAERKTTRGLQMEARGTAPTWEMGLSAVV